MSMLFIAAIANKASNAAAEARLAALSGQTPSMDYFTDTLLRPNPQPPAGSASPAATPGVGVMVTESRTPSANGSANSQRLQISRILLTSLGPSGMSNDDRSYLVQTVGAQTGISQDEAQRRVDDVTSRIKQAAESARKAAAYLSFWTFMSLLFGAVCAALGGVLGGDLRDEIAIREAVPMSPL